MGGDDEVCDPGENIPHFGFGPFLREREQGSLGNWGGQGTLFQRQVGAVDCLALGPVIPRMFF